MRPEHLTNSQLDELASAVETLRIAAVGAYRVSPQVRNAINTLDNADLFAEIDAEHFARVADYALRNEER